MKNKTIKLITTTTITSILCLSVSSLAFAGEDKILEFYNTDFDDCFSEGYNVSELSKEQVYITAECFSSLLEKESRKTASIGANKLTILQYANSWYSAAANKDHKLAQAKLEQNLTVLASLEQETHYGRSQQSQQLLASERNFNQLDVNSDQLLSLDEASASNRVIQNFSKADYDNDGKISSGEYAIEFGEMTAAGQSPH